VAEPEAKLELGVGGPGFVHLNHFGALINEAYGHMPYLVGSATRGKQWRDVDVRLILPDDEFDVLFGSQRPFGLGARFSLLCAAISALGEKYTGLPIDFQFQPQTHANDKYPEGFRQPLGLWNLPAVVDVVEQLRAEARRHSDVAAERLRQMNVLEEQLDDYHIQHGVKRTWHVAERRKRYGSTSVDEGNTQ